jgi:hypothetical protein
MVEEQGRKRAVPWWTPKQPPQLEFPAVDNDLPRAGDRLAVAVNGGCRQRERQRVNPGRRHHRVALSGSANAT